MKIIAKNTWFVTALLAVAAIYTGCHKGPDIKTYTYPAPEPQAISPSSDYAGKTVTITGTSFGDYSNVVKVYFNGILADTVISCEDTKIVVKVPDNAISGKVSLQVWTNKIDSIGTFTVKAPPTITKVDPLTVLPGDTVRIYGTGYGTDITKAKVDFAGTSANVAYLEDTVITTVVPVGASSGNLGIIIDGYPVTGPQYVILVSVPAPIYELDFEGNLTDKMGGASATYTFKTAEGKDLQYVAGKTGQAVLLAGSQNLNVTDNQTLGLPANITKQKELTVACWVNWTNDSTTWTQEPIFDAGLSRGSRVNLMTRMTSGFGTNMVGRLSFENVGPFTGANPFNAQATPLKKKEWHHVALVVSPANGYMKVYLDGTETGTVVIPGTADLTLFNHSSVRIGSPVGGSKKEPSFGGMIDNFKVFNVALSRDQLFTDYYRSK